MKTDRDDDTDDENQPLTQAVHSRGSRRNWQTLFVAVVSFVAGFSCCFVMQPGMRPSDPRDDLDTALDRGLEIAASVEHRAMPLPSNCYPLVDAKSLASKGRSLTMIRTRIAGIRQFSLFIHPLSMDQYASQEMIIFGENHPSTTAALRVLLPRCFGAGALFYDIGANVGYFTHLSARLGARVIAIEPTAYHRRLLHLSLTINQLQHSVVVVPRALTATATALTATACMDMDPVNAGNTYASVGKACRPEMLAKLTTLSRVIEKHGPPELIKVDVEGFEILALQGGEELLAKSPPSVIVFEYNSATWPIAPTARAWVEDHPEAGLNSTGGLEARNRQMAAELVAFFYDGPMGRARYVLHDLNAPVSLGGAQGRADWLAYLSGGLQAKLNWNTDLLLISAEFAAKHELNSLVSLFALGEEPDGSTALGARRFMNRARLRSPNRRFEAYLQFDGEAHSSVCVGPAAPPPSQTVRPRPDVILFNQDDGNLCMRRGMSPQAATAPLWCHASSRCMDSAEGCALRVTNQGELRWGKVALGKGGSGGEVLASIRGSSRRQASDAVCFSK